MAVFALALAVRLVGIDWGLPNKERHYPYHPDEFLNLAIANYQTNPFAGDFSTGFYNYPPLPFYLFSAVYHGAQAYGFVATPSRDATDEDRAEFHASLLRIGRWLVALFGALTCLLTFVLGARWLPIWAAAMGAAALAVAPGFLMHSRFQTVDVMSAFFVAACLWQTAKLAEDPTAGKRLVFAALCAAAAAGCKYNLAVVLIAPISAIWLQGQAKPRVKAVRTLLLALFFTIGFLALCPGVWLEFGQFWKDFTFELRHAQEGHGLVFVDTGPGWLYHLDPNLTAGFGGALLLASTIGLAGLARQKEAVGALLFFAIFFVLLGFAQIRFMRYLLPLFPILALGVGNALFVGARMLTDGRSGMKPIGLGLFILTLGGIAHTAAMGYAWTQVMLDHDPRYQAKVALEDNDSGSIAFVKDPWFYTPPLFPQSGALTMQDRQVGLVDRPYLIAMAPPEWNVHALREKRPEWVVISEFEYFDDERLRLPDCIEFMKELTATYELAFAFGKKGGLLPKNPPHDMLYVYPEVRLYRLKR